MMNLVLVGERGAKDENGVSCREEVYKIGNYKVIVDWEDEKVDSIDIRENWEIDYVPEIRYKRNKWDIDKKPKFEIQTTAYGSQEVEEIQKVIQGYQEAIEVVEILTKKFL